MSNAIKFAAVGIVGLSALGYAIYSFLTVEQNPTVVEVQTDPAKVEELVNEEVAKATYVPDIQLSATAIEVTKDPALVKKRKEEQKRAEKEAAQAAKEAEKQAALAAKEAEKAAKEAAREATASAATSTNTSSGSSSSGSSSSAKASGSFFLIAGAFSSEANARNRVKQLKNSGYSSAGVVGQNEKGYYLVAYKGFSSRSQAESYMPEIKSKGLSTWVYPPAK